MVQFIQTKTLQAISYEDFLEYIAENIDMEDDGSVIEASEKLIALKNNRQFFIKLLTRELILEPNSEKSLFISHHSMMLGRGKSKRGGLGFAIRLNFWPVVQQSDFLKNSRKSVEMSFSYNYPHDHNFSLLTAGYFGPGYSTDVYVRSPEDALESIGKNGNLKFSGRFTLAEGQIMFLRKSKDIHVQLPPASFSMSLNLIPSRVSDCYTEQYEFDLSNGTIKDYVVGSRISNLTSLIRLTSKFGVIDAVPSLLNILSDSPSPRLRLESLSALIELKPGDSTYFCSIAFRDQHKTVRSSARSYLLQSSPTTRAI